MIDRVLSCCLVCNISNITIVVVSVVLDMLDSSIRKKNAVAALNITLAIISLVSINVGATVVIMNTILIVIGVSWFLVMMWSWNMMNWRKNRSKVVSKNN